MNNLQKYELVNSCETAKELEQAVRLLTDPETGMIQGRTKQVDGEAMASMVIPIVKGEQKNPNYLTREFGIRQQALYLKYYKK